MPQYLISWEALGYCMLLSLPELHTVVTHVALNYLAPHWSSDLQLI